MSKTGISISQYEDKNAYQREWRKLNSDKCKEYGSKRNVERARENAWMRRYGVTREWYENKLKEQNNTCAICGTSEIGREGHTHFHVDHDHTTGQVRGLLCDLCNRGLGYFKDKPDLLNKASDYLRVYY